MKQTYKYRLFPTKTQRGALNKALEACRWVYNQTLETRKTAWELRKESVSRYDTFNMLPEWKKEHAFLSNAYSQCLRDACARVDLAFQAFFRRVKCNEKPGYPRFRGADRYDSFTFPQSGFKFTNDKKLYLSKIGNVKIRLHRSIEGKIKTLTIKRDRLGNWYACFSCEVEAVPLAPVSRVVGVDVGLLKFATFSTGKQIDNPRFFRKDEQVLAKTQRKLSRSRRGSFDYHKHKRVIQHIHKRITNRRKDFAHKLSRRLVNEFQVIVFEDLDIQDMQKNNWRGMNKSISDAAWNQLVRYTMYKAEYAGRSVILVDPRNTSKMCSSCGQIVKKALSERTHRCPHCGLEIDRDLNASLNILARGLASLNVSSRSFSFQ